MPLFLQVWTNNTAEERLLGVSLTGIMDNRLLSGQEGHDKLTPVLQDLRSQAVEVGVLGGCVLMIAWCTLWGVL
jgi:ribonucleoside-diphosphate reductase alpha chain